VKVLRIDLDEQELPATVQVEMTLAEAVLITKHVGNLLPATSTSNGLWEALTGSLFNRFWDEGVDGVRGVTP
jgi:hypothetical protein